MPAAAVIPAPIAYINVVAVKKLVVEVKVFRYVLISILMYLNSSFQYLCRGIRLSLHGSWSFTVRKVECSKHTFV